MNHKEKAMELFKKGYNCSQSVICTFAEEYGIREEDAFRISEGFGGGLGKSGYTCGALSGMVMVLSLAKSPSLDLAHPTKQITYPIVEEAVKRFMERNTYMNCKDLLEYKDTTMIDGKKAICAKVVQDSCDIIEELLND